MFDAELIIISFKAFVFSTSLPHCIRSESPSLCDFSDHQHLWLLFTRQSQQNMS